MSSDVRQLLRPYLRRVRRQIRLNRFGLCACAGAGAAIAVLLLSFAIPVPRAPVVAAAAAAAVCLLSGVVAALLQPPLPAMAAEIDRHGFQERVQTLLALQGSASPFAQLQRVDTFRALGSADPKTRIPVRCPRKPYALAGAGLALACILALLPSPQDGILQERARIDQVLREQVQRVEASLDLLDRNNALSDLQRADLNQKLQELAQELRNGADYKESIRQISQLQQQVKDIQSAQDARNRQDMDSLRDSLAQQPQTGELAERMENRTAEQAAAEIRQAAQQAMEQGGQERQDLAQALREAAQGMENEAMQSALEDLADALEQGDGEGVEQALQSLEEAAENSSQSAGTMDQINGQLQMAKARIGQLSLADSGDIAQFQPGAQGGQNGQGMDSQGQNGDSGSGDGPEGPGQNPGAGTGSGDSGQEGPSGNADGSGAGYGSGDLVESERVYSGERLEASGDTERLQGEMDAGGPRSQMDTAPGDGTLDGYIIYHDVAGEYAEDAINAARREELPPTVQDWVEGYFSALQE